MVIYVNMVLKWFVGTVITNNKWWTKVVVIQHSIKEQPMFVYGLALKL